MTPPPSKKISTYMTRVLFVSWAGQKKTKTLFGTSTHSFVLLKCVLLNISIQTGLTWCSSGLTLHFAPVRTPSRTTKRCLSSLATWCSSPQPSLWLLCALSLTTSLRSAVMPLSSAQVCRGPLESEWRASASGRSEVHAVKANACSLVFSAVVVN